MDKKSPQVVAITGANGFVGSALVNHFAARGWKVIALVRKPEDYTSTQAVTYTPYDLNEPMDESLLSTVDYLVHAAYLPLAQNPNAYEINLTGAKNLIASAGRTKNLRHTVFISTMSAHEDALSVYGKQKIAIEQLFEDMHATILKCGLIIGDGGIVKDMASFMTTKHAVPLIDGGKQPLQIVALTDLVHIIEKVLLARPDGRFIIATPTVYSYKSFYHALAKHLNVKVLYVPVPFVVLRGAFKVAARLGIKTGVGEDNLLGLKMLRSMDSQPDLKKLGVTLQDLDAALKSM